MKSEGTITIKGDPEVLSEVYEAIVETLVGACPVRVGVDVEGDEATLTIAASDPDAPPRYTQMREGAAIQ